MDKGIRRLLGWLSFVAFEGAMFLVADANEPLHGTDLMLAGAVWAGIASIAAAAFALSNWHPAG